MAFVNKTLEDMLREIGVTRTLRYDTIIPAMHPDCPKEWRPPADFKKIPAEQELKDYDFDLWSSFVNAYIPELAGLFWRIERRSGILNTLSKIKIHSPIDMALENAFYHGNKNNPNLPVYFMAFEGNKGFVVSVKDSGNGFDSRETIAKLELFKMNNPERNGIFHAPPEQKYCKRWGSGFWAYMAHPVDVSFEDGGRRVNLLFRK